MKTSYILIAVVVAVVVIGGVFVFQSNNNSQTPSLDQEENMMSPIGEQPQSSPMVMYSDAGYSPGEMRIKKGETVTFKNQSSMPMWTASAVHPSHMAYPGTDIKNCGDSMMGMMFDSCAGVSAGQVWKFQFNETGEWGYHNHLRPTHWGKIIVE